MKAESEVLLEKPDKWEPTSGIGLLNVYRRIRIRYGEPFTLEIESKLSQGTLVRIILPYPAGKE